MNRLVHVLDRPEPTVAVTFTEPLSDGAILSIAKVADVAELRADTYPSCRFNYLSAQARRLGALPTILTIRSGTEGGQWHGSETKRLQLFSSMLPEIDGVDVELAAEILPDVTQAAHDQDKAVIASYHNFDAMPSASILEDKVDGANEAGVDYVKLAVSAKTAEEFQRLVTFTLKHMGQNLITVAMDAYGPMSRVFLSSFGSHLTYAFPGESAIDPGQLGYLETHKLLIKLNPNYARLFHN